MVYWKPSLGFKFCYACCNVETFLDARDGQVDPFTLVPWVCKNTNHPRAGGINYSSRTNESSYIDWLLHPIRRIDTAGISCLWDSDHPFAKGRITKGLCRWLTVWFPFAQGAHPECSWLDWVKQDYSWGRLTLRVATTAQALDPQVLVQIKTLWTRH